MPEQYRGSGRAWSRGELVPACDRVATQRRGLHGAVGIETEIHDRGRDPDSGDAELDRLGRSLKHLLDLVADLQRRGIGLISLTDAINTSSAQGRLVLNLFASLAEFERELIRERTLAGLAAARARGRVGGRKPGLSEEAQRTARAAELLYNARALSVDDMARSLRICKATFYKYLHHRGVALHAQPLPSPVVGAVA